MLKIAYDCQVFSWQDYGGISRYFVELATRVGTTDGFYAEVVAPLYVNTQLRDSGVKVMGMDARRLPQMPGRLLRGINRFATVGYLAATRPCVVHETYYGTWSSRPRGSAIVVTIHDMADHIFPHLYTADNPTPARKAQAIRRADVIICVSENTRRDLLERYRIPEERTHVVHLGHGLSGGPPVDLPTSAMITGPYLLYVGDRDRQKNFACLLRAYAASLRLRRDLRIVAFGRQRLQAQEIALARELGIESSQLIQCGGDDAVLAGLYSRAAAFVYPSLYEGFGLPPLEAMSFGCPVICSNSSSIPEVVGDAGVLFDPQDAGALREAIERVIYDDSQRAKLIARGYRRTAHFSWDRCAAETMEVYRQSTGH
jgi:glycosyltransferase involved in cell wall biosynthesis